ncbi:short chain dehydrogenase reductase [Phlyctema vagabunda]|uniref:Short chain dehydrogenase reductase n=1 Tax=Phlyctema vagabunda TaxID=108571 RepID=A0ABR4PSU6_9HELO
MATLSPMDTPGVTLHHATYPFIAPPKYRKAHQGKVVLITGAGRGIGKATALAFAAAGAHVAVLARTTQEVAAVVTEIKTRFGVPTLGITGSVLDDAAAIVRQVEEELGPIDILINNAGTQRMAPFAAEEDLGIWWRVFEVNLKAPLAFIHAVLPSFLARGRGTSITVGSAASEQPLPNMSAYVGSKAGLQRTIEMLDAELRPQGLLNFYLHPGSVNTALADPNNAELYATAEMRTMIKGFHEILIDTPELAADSMVALTANETGAHFLSGRFVSVNEDLGELLAKREEIESRNLFHLRVQRP